MPDPLCSICLSTTLRLDREKHLQMCNSCSELHGVIPLPRSRRPPVPCRGCNGNKFVRAVPREFTRRNDEAYVAPMAVTFAYKPPVVQTFGGHVPQTLDAKLSFGQLEMYICKKCGLVDWFCFDPEQIPIGPAHMTEDIDYESTSGPYR